MESNELHNEEEGDVYIKSNKLNTIQLKKQNLGTLKHNDTTQMNETETF